jgi:hypothetical protein
MSDVLRDLYLISPRGLAGQLGATMVERSTWPNGGFIGGSSAPDAATVAVRAFHEIKSLRNQLAQALKERDEARGALKPFAEEARHWHGLIGEWLLMPHYAEGYKPHYESTLTANDLFRAAAAFKIPAFSDAQLPPGLPRPSAERTLETE